MYSRCRVDIYLSWRVSSTSCCDSYRVRQVKITRLRVLSCSSPITKSDRLPVGRFQRGGKGGAEVGGRSWVVGAVAGGA